MANQDEKQILKQLHQVKFGEHTVLVLPDIYALRNAYARFSKKRLEHNEAIMIIAYYDTVSGVKHYLRELDVDVEKHLKTGSLIIIDGLAEFNQSETSFLQRLAMIGDSVKTTGKEGISVIMDMGLFFHGHNNDLFEFEQSMARQADFVCKCLLCCYNAADFGRLSEPAQRDLAALHHKKIMVSG